MGSKAEISWKTKSPEGDRREVYVNLVGHDWRFFVREKRYDEWQPLPVPLLEDWLELLDAVQRRVNRRLLQPDDEARVRRKIREAHPEAEI
jgi:hypothetical protein